MPDLPPLAQKALPYWGVIESAVSRGATTAELWSDIRSAATEWGLESPGVSAIGVSQLRGMAGQIRARGQEFAQLPDGRRVYSTLWADAPWQRTSAERRLDPRWAVRFQHTYTQGGDTLTEWRTVMQYGRPPRTAGEIRASVEGEALNMARKYNIGHLGTGDYQLLIV